MWQFVERQLDRFSPVEWHAFRPFLVCKMSGVAFVFNASAVGRIVCSLGNTIWHMSGCMNYRVAAVAPQGPSDTAARMVEAARQIYGVDHERGTGHHVCAAILHEEVYDEPTTPRPDIEHRGPVPMSG